jgi:SAM-dependent methyltransferase
MFNIEKISNYYDNYKKNALNTNVSENETMFNEWYWDVGKSAVEVIISAMGASFLGNVYNVLDMPCGHGRVLRHLLTLFPDAKFTACDLDEDGVEYCAKTFGAKPLISQPELCDVDFGEKYELIWVGSLFTHTPEDQTQRWLAHLAKFLTPTGIIVATFHGRHAIKMHSQSPYIADKSWDKIIKGYKAGGYGYADYSTEEAHDYMDTQYGISVSTPTKILAMAQAIPGIRIFQYAERAWADHQDVLVIGRPAFDD